MRGLERGNAAKMLILASYGSASSVQPAVPSISVEKSSSTRAPGGCVWEIVVCLQQGTLGSEEV